MSQSNEPDSNSEMHDGIGLDSVLGRWTTSAPSSSSAATLNNSSASSSSYFLRPESSSGFVESLANGIVDERGDILYPVSTNGTSVHSTATNYFNNQLALNRDQVRTDPQQPEHEKGDESESDSTSAPFVNSSTTGRKVPGPCSRTNNHLDLQLLNFQDTRPTFVSHEATHFNSVSSLSAATSTAAGLIQVLNAAINQTASNVAQNGGNFNNGTASSLCISQVRGNYSKGMFDVQQSGHEAASVGAPSNVDRGNIATSTLQSQQQEERSQTVDSSSGLPEQYTIVFDEGSQSLTLQRVVSPVHRAQQQQRVMPPLHRVQQQPGGNSRDTPQTNQQLISNQPTICSSSRNSGEVSTCSLQGQPTLPDQPDPPGVAPLASCSTGLVSGEATTMSSGACSDLKLKLMKVKPEMPECDTTQVEDNYSEQHEGIQHERKPLSVRENVSEAVQGVRKSRRLQQVAEEAKASMKKRNFMPQQYDRNHLWCEECMEAFTDQCPVHRLTAVPDKIVLSRAWASCPNHLQICRLPEAEISSGESSMGVLAKRQIPKLTQFGPFFGDLVDSLNKVTRLYFPLMLDSPNGSRQYYETSDENQCNWMMFVRPARTFAEQNLVAYQHKKSIFFSSTKAIEPKHELKVWYAAHYAQQMGVKTLQLTEEDIQALDEADGKFPCSVCPRRFKSWAALHYHLNVHEDEDEDEQAERADDLLTDFVDNGAADVDFLLEEDEASVDMDSRKLEASAAEDGGSGFVSARRVVQGRWRPGRGRRRRASESKRKKNSFMALALRKYKRTPGQRSVGERGGMYRHRGKLHGGNEWMCTHCGLTFDNASLLNLHTLTHAAEDVGLEEIRKLVAEQAENSGTQQCVDNSSPDVGTPNRVGVKCKDTQTADSDSPLSHLQEQTAAKQETSLTVACPKCNVTFNHHKELMDHVSMHAHKPYVKDSRRFPCKLCGKYFSSLDKLSQHRLVHGDDSAKPFECKVCHKRFVNNSALACHMKKHGTRKYYACPLCGQDFNTATQLKDHGHTDHSNSDGKFPCTSCHKVFEEFVLLKKHVRTFHSDKVFKCTVCDKSFPMLEKLKMHMLRHTTHREFMCETCGKQFKRKDKLKDHIKKLHSGSGGITRVLESRLGESADGADVDSKPRKFTPKVQPSEYHLFIYKCHTCLLGFKRRGMLVNHLAKRHPEIKIEQVPELNLPILKTQKDYYCQYCDKIYKSNSKRKEHIKKAHPGCEPPPPVKIRNIVSLLPGVGGELSGTMLREMNDLAGADAFSHVVSSVSTMPHGCKFCHKQYASKAKLYQHQKKQHPDMYALTVPNKKLKKYAGGLGQAAQSESKDDPNVDQAMPTVTYAAGDNNQASTLQQQPPLSVVPSSSSSPTIAPLSAPLTAPIQAPHTADLLNLAMSELTYSGAGAAGITNLSSLLSSLNTVGGVGGVPTATNTINTIPAAGGATVHIQSGNNNQFQPATIDLSQLSQQLNQAFSVPGGGQMAQTGAALATVLQSSLSPSQQQQPLQSQQQQQQQSQQQGLPQHLTLVGPNGQQQLFNIGACGQLIPSRQWQQQFR